MEQLLHYPHVREYIAQLPQGFASYPEAQVMALSYSKINDSFPDFTRDSQIPAVFKQLADGSYTEKWTSQVNGNAILLLLRDKYFQSDDAFIRWYRDTIVAPTFTRPLIRAALFVFSPSLAVMGAAKRWSSLHRGTSLESLGVKPEGALRTGDLKLSFPAGLFAGELLRRRVAEALFFVLEASGGKQATIVSRELSSCECRFELRWSQ